MTRTAGQVQGGGMGPPTGFNMAAVIKVMEMTGETDEIVLELVEAAQGAIIGDIHQNRDNRD